MHVLRSSLLGAAGFLAAALAGTAPAQTPPDGLIVSHFTSGGGVGGVAIVDNVALTSTLVNGGLACVEANSVAIDPYDPSKVYIGGHSPGGSACPTPTDVTQLTLSGTTVIASTLVATLPPPADISIPDMVFDDDGNLFVTSEDFVYHLDLATGTPTLLYTIPTAPSGSVAALAYDAVGNDLYVGLTVLGQVHHVDPETAVATPVNLAPTSGITGSTTITGVTLSEDLGTVYASTFGSGNPGGPSGPTWIVQMTTDSSQWPVVPAPLDLMTMTGTLNDVEIHGTKMYTAAGSAMLVHEIDLSTGPPHPATMLGYYPGALTFLGSRSQVDVNEYLDDLTVFPRRPAAGSAVSMRMALGGPPGQFGVMGIVGFDADGPGPSPFVFSPLVLGVGSFTAPAGNLALPAFPVAIPGGSTGATITLGFARIDTMGSLAALDLTAADVEIQ